MAQRKTRSSNHWDSFQYLYSSIHTPAHLPWDWIKTRSPLGDSLLHHAVKEKHLTRFIKLHQAGASFHEKDANGLTVVGRIIDENWIEGLEYLFSVLIPEEHSQLLVGDCCSQTNCHEQLESTNKCSYSVDPESSLKFKNSSPVYLAVKQSNLEIIKCIVQNTSRNVIILNKILQYSVQGSKWVIMKYILEQGSDTKCLKFNHVSNVIEQRRWPPLRTLLHYGLNPNLCSNHTRPPQNLLTLCDELEFDDGFKLLLEYGADACGDDTSSLMFPCFNATNQTCLEGQTHIFSIPVCRLASEGRLALLKELIDLNYNLTWPAGSHASKNTDPEICNNMDLKHDSALYCAISGQQWETAAMLLFSGPDPSAYQKPTKRIVQMYPKKKWLQNFFNSPRPLTSLCRSRIRLSLRTPIKNKLECLMIPTKIKQFLLFDDLFGL